MPENRPWSYRRTACCLQLNRANLVLWSAIATNRCHGQTCGVCAMIGSKQISKANW